ncbi:MAG: glycogen synthase [Piptocephalis tieghemiana]|nr:MAG: glycogen synthase [Piptocephalis tieghemiana]
MSHSPTASPDQKDIHKPLLFECAWEVANKVGGIYTVIKTKAPVTAQEFGDRFCLIGPLNMAKAPLEVESLAPSDPAMIRTLNAMEQAGVRYLYGRWLIEGAPTVLLFDIGCQWHRLGEWKADIWSLANIPCPDHDREQNDAIVFGYIVAWFLGEYMAQRPNKAIIAHFHEWQAGVGLILARKRKMALATIFTTHATLLGRYLCAGDTDFYNNLRFFDLDAEAGRRGIYHRYCLERSAAHCAHVFTTVSHITAYEAEHLLKRKPDGVLPNGLNVVKFSAVHEFQNLHAVSKERIHDFVRGHFYGHYDFDLDNTLYFFTAGRYEFRNKGVDMLLEALARLNAKLQARRSPITVVSFIIMPAPNHSYSVDTLKGQAVVKQLRETVDAIQANVGKRIFESALQGKEPPSRASDLLTEQEKVLMKRRIYSLKRGAYPSVVTHNMVNDSEDQVLSRLREIRLYNQPSDRVKVIFHPEFINASNPVLGLDYDEFVRGCHLGVFPSYYEPWGYTPAECTVMGVPSVTTNLSGFGCYMEDNIESPADYGIYIVDRRLKSGEESIEQLAEQMLSFCLKSRRQRINQRNRTERLSDLLDWKRMGLEYIKARRLALRRAFPDDYAAAMEAAAATPPPSTKKVPRPISVPGSPRHRGTDDPLAYQLEQLGFGPSANSNDDGDDMRFDAISLKSGGVLTPKDLEDE